MSFGNPESEDGTYYNMRERFNQAIFDLINTKSEKCVLFTRDKYISLIEQVKLAKTVNRKKTPVDYKRLKRYDIFRDGDSERLISPITEDDDTVRHFVCIEEIFDIIHRAHIELDHAGRSRLEKHLHAKYNNITKESINLFLKLCETCQKRRNGEISFNRPRLPRIASVPLKRQKPGQKLLLKTEKALTVWLLEKAAKGLQISDRVLREKALALYSQNASTFGMTNPQKLKQQFKASKDWLFRFRSTFNQQHSMNSFNDNQTMASSNSKVHTQNGAASVAGYNYSVLDQLIDPSSINCDDDDHSQDNGEDDVPSWNYSKFNDVLQTASYLTEMITKYDPNRERSRLISRNINHQLKPYREMFDLLKEHELSLNSSQKRSIKPAPVQSISEQSSSSVNPDHSHSQLQSQPPMPGSAISTPQLLSHSQLPASSFVVANGTVSDHSALYMNPQFPH